MSNPVCSSSSSSSGIFPTTPTRSISAPATPKVTLVVKKVVKQPQPFPSSSGVLPISGRSLSSLLSSSSSSLSSVVSPLLSSSSSSTSSSSLSSLSSSSSSVNPSSTSSLGSSSSLSLTSSSTPSSVVSPKRKQVSPSSFTSPQGNHGGGGGPGGSPDLLRSPMDYHFFKAMEGMKGKPKKKFMKGLPGKKDHSVAPDSAKKQSDIAKREFARIKKISKGLALGARAPEYKTYDGHGVVVMSTAQGIRICINDKNGRSRVFGIHIIPDGSGKPRARLYPCSGDGVVNIRTDLLKTYIETWDLMTGPNKVSLEVYLNLKAQELLATSASSSSSSSQHPLSTSTGVTPTPAPTSATPGLVQGGGGGGGGPGVTSKPVKRSLFKQS